MRVLDHEKGEGLGGMLCEPEEVVGAWQFERFFFEFEFFFEFVPHVIIGFQKGRFPTLHNELLLVEGVCLV